MRPMTERSVRGPSTLLDSTSRAIISELQRDGRRPYAAIGKAVGLSGRWACRRPPSGRECSV